MSSRHRPWPLRAGASATWTPTMRSAAGSSSVEATKPSQLSRRSSVRCRKLDRTIMSVVSHITGLPRLISSCVALKSIEHELEPSEKLRVSRVRIEPLVKASVVRKIGLLGEDVGRTTYTFTGCSSEISRWCSSHRVIEARFVEKQPSTFRKYKEELEKASARVNGRPPLRGAVSPPAESCPGT